MIELNGDDLRREPLEVRKVTLASLLAKARPGIRVNEHIEADGPTVFAHACKMGLEGIVSKRKGSTTDPAGHAIGSKARTRLVRQRSGRLRRIGKGASPRGEAPIGNCRFHVVDDPDYQYEDRGCSRRRSRSDPQAVEQNHNSLCFAGFPRMDFQTSCTLC